MKKHAKEESNLHPVNTSQKTKRYAALDQVASALCSGKVYRREDLAQVSNAVDRHLRELVSGGALVRLAQGLYYVPKKSVFGGHGEPDLGVLPLGQRAAFVSEAIIEPPQLATLGADIEVPPVHAAASGACRSASLT